MLRLISQMSLDDRPREKLAARGVGALTDMELLAVLLGQGSRKRPVMALAEEVRRVFDVCGGNPQLADLMAVRGVGPAKGKMLLAAMEFARRRIRPHGVKIKSPQDLLPYLRHYADRPQEHFLCTSLNGAGEMIATRVVTIGLVNKTQVHPREVFAAPIQDRAASIIVAHNHPSGNVKPSQSDILLTRRLQEAGDLLGIPLQDHIIFSLHDHYSFDREAENDLFDPIPEVLTRSA